MLLNVHRLLDTLLLYIRFFLDVVLLVCKSSSRTSKRDA
jgi:hypothetical protein